MNKTNVKTRRNSMLCIVNMEKIHYNVLKANSLKRILAGFIYFLFLKT